MKERKPIIGIVARSDVNKTDRNCMITLDRYRIAILKNGGIPIVILPTQQISYEAVKVSEVPQLSDEEKDDLIKQIEICDGILLPGGDKIYYYDTFIAKYALDNDIPLLGICMGMQIMGIVDNEDFDCLVDVVNPQFHKKSLKGDCFHEILIKRDTLFYKLFQKDHKEVNSIHTKVLSRLNKFQISAISKYDEIEAIELNDKKFAIGVQWHPELMLDESPDMNKIFKEFIDKSN